jgi:hypothetical protein
MITEKISGNIEKYFELYCVIIRALLRKMQKHG